MKKNIGGENNGENNENDNENNRNSEKAIIGGENRNGVTAINSMAALRSRRLRCIINTARSRLLRRAISASRRGTTA
jgi:hypothetical protein